MNEPTVTTEPPGILPPYSGDETTCAKCAHGTARTTYRPARVMRIHLDEDRVRSGLLPERLERECERCEYRWDEALCPPGPGMTVDALAHALAHAVPFPLELPPEALDYTARMLLTMVVVDARPDHRVWQYDNGRPTPTSADTTPADRQATT